MVNNLEAAIAEAGSPVALLWNNPAQPAVVPYVVPEFTNWRSEQMAWRTNAVLFDQSHHMADLNISGPDALKVIRDTAINSVDDWPVDVAKQYIAVNKDGYIIGDNILFHLAEDEYQAVGIPPSINWLHYKAATGGYDVKIWRDDNSLYRSGDPKVYRYQVQGPGALEVWKTATGLEELPKLKFFHMYTFTIAGRPVRAVRHGMAGEPGYEFWGPWSDHDAVRAAILEAGAKHGMIQVGGRAYHTNALESGWLPRPIPAIFDDPELADFRTWLNEEGGRAYEMTAPLGGSFYSENIADYYFTPFETDYGRIVNFDHDFIGKEALQKMIESGEAEARKKVTFVWDQKEAGDAYAASLFTASGEGPKFISLPMSLYDTFHTDRVETADGTLVGRSQWVGYSANERTILSLGSVLTEHSTPGTELYLVWGEAPNSGKAQIEPHTQVRIKVIVEPAPLTDKARSTYRSNEGATV